MFALTAAYCLFYKFRGVNNPLWDTHVCPMIKIISNILIILHINVKTDAYFWHPILHRYSFLQ